ncbi:recombinase family protein [Mesorhizobium sp. M4B.F.Ca.ET.190.01.1.1]|nr:recombinase family protein [Mesorhizobium sp. M4B.F.Ca.ET.200.01.1.1]TGS13099.1 recombinase family protein [Mesorhizobium sp. M4B.F.Ca.ET.190.01.1.1]TGT25478.1 recombinase family protein [Mesorhizobium sp. M4B.F.Ca.ET.172.01.1.1]
MSTDIQLKGDSLRRQTERSKQYADEHGLDLVEDFKLEDIGVSAFKGDNLSSGALGKFLDAVKAGRIPRGSYLLVESFDRLSRQKLNASVSLFFDITSNGINLVTLSDNQLYKAGEAEFAQLIMSIVVMARANEESEMKSQRLSAAWDAKRRAVGEKKLTGLCPAWLELSEDRKDFYVIEDRAQVVRRIFEDSASGQGSFVITRRLNDAGIPAFGRSTGWVQSYVTKILQARAVLGEFQPHTKQNGRRVPLGDSIPGYYPQIVDENLFLRAQFARGKRRIEGGGRKGEALRNLFTHLATCGYCGAPMHFLNKGTGPRGGTYLKCRHALRGMDCVPTAWRYQDFERSFFLFVKEIDLAEMLRASSQKSEVLILDERAVALAEKKSELELKRERTYALIDDGAISVEFLTTKLRECEAELASVEQQIADVDGQRQEIREQQSISPDELRLLIDQLQQMEGPEAFLQRSMLATRLREIVTELKLEVEGSLPRQSRAAAFLDAADIDPQERNQILDHIERSNREALRYNRSFSVVLADGVSRRVVLRNDDPTDFVAEVLVDKDGTISGSDRGMPIG